MREFVAIIIGSAAALGWLAIWACTLHVFGVPIFRQTVEERASRRERLKWMGKLRYVLIFGVFGLGLAFGLGITVADLLDNPHGWAFAVGKLALLSVLLGWFHGARTWGEVFRDPVPFPPDYPPLK